MDWSRWVLVFVAFFCLVRGLGASDGDADPVYKSCLEECQTTGCVGKKCFQHCKFSSDGKPIDGPWYHQEPLYQRWKQWDCQSDCEYHCMISREDERLELGLKPVKYHGRWPFHRVYGIQEPVSVALAAVILALQFHGWISFFILVYYKLSLRPNKKTYYEYTGLWHIYALLCMNAWFWCAVYHTRDVELTEKLYFSSTVAWVGFSLILATLRAFDIRDEAARVMIAAPVIAFVTTHILYLNFYNFDKASIGPSFITLDVFEKLVPTNRRSECQSKRVTDPSPGSDMARLGYSHSPSIEVEAVAGSSRGRKPVHARRSIRLRATWEVRGCSSHLARSSHPPGVHLVEFCKG
ncbi:unnamed protein product [Linum tenue]|uniref:Post-GPI attachment to proteins factor 3 n=1 Tax=Linum tenue TaxID=586396 RepID=A0AAV0J3Z7_9ROSI|nr:unnamed protein product [Linum tenue]